MKSNLVSHRPLTPAWACARAREGGGARFRARVRASRSTMAATTTQPPHPSLYLLPCAPRAGSLAPELEAALAPDEAASAFLSRVSADPVPSGLPLVGSLRPGEVLEFVGPSGCGKTALLVQVGRKGAEAAPDWRLGRAAPSIFLLPHLTSPHLTSTQVAAATILPTAWEGVAVGGRGGKKGESGRERGGERTHTRPCIL